MCRLKSSLYLLLGLLLALISLSAGLYEDQIGKFDWKRDLIGQLKFSHFDSSTSNVKKLFVATHENVVAALGLKSGEIKWRRVLEKSSQGAIQFLGVDSNVVTVSGTSPAYVRSWNSNSGILESEWTLPSTLADNQVVLWFMLKGHLFRVIVVAPSHLDITSFNVNNGVKLTSKQIPVSWISGITGCKLSAPYLACLVKKDDQVLYTINLSSQEAEIQSTLVSTLFAAQKASELSLETVLGSLPAVALLAGDVKQVVTFGPTGASTVCTTMPSEASAIITTYEKNNVLLQSVLRTGVLELSGCLVETGAALPDLAGSMSYESSWSAPVLSAAVCQPRKDRSMGCRLTVSTSDHVVALLHHPGRVVWAREEALAGVTAVDMLDLPLSDADSAIEKEFDHQDSGFVGMLVHRVTSQLLQLTSLVTSLLGMTSASPAERSGLVRDEFSLHKMVVVATRAGKVFGLNNQDGQVVWQRNLPEIDSFSDIGGRKKMILYVQRSTRHYPHAAQCALVAKHKVTGEGVLFVFNPFNGAGIGGDAGLTRLGYRVKQTLLLHQPDRDFLRGILLLDSSDRLHTAPASCSRELAAVAASTFLYTADAATGTLVGYSLAHSTPEAPAATRVWEVKLGQPITAIVAKNPLEKVHSQGRVLGDRSVLYKYNNPNLVAVVTQGPDPVHKNFLNVHLVDAVSGAVVFSASHKRAREPVHVVHSENWLVYSYFSEKSRRTELASLELYEGKIQSNTTAFSSIHAPLQPIVDRQAYILPTTVDAMRETITEKGITSKHILMALSNGGILELPWMFVDPRRPITATPEMREEGVIPYMPELPIPADAIINYNQSLVRVDGIHTAPSGLESTSLVLVYGLDLFYTRVAPSKTFDVLKEDFDHVLISAVLLALIVASYATKKLASKKALKQAWK